MGSMTASTEARQGKARPGKSRVNRVKVWDKGKEGGCSKRPQPSQVSHQWRRRDVYEVEYGVRSTKGT